MKTRLLIVEDHPAMITGYRTLLSCIQDMDFEIDEALTGAEAYNILSQGVKSYDIIILDLLIPSCLEKGIESGVDLVTMIRLNMPKSKIVVLTSQVQSLELYTVYNNYKPDGFLVKSDFSGSDFMEMIAHVLAGSQVLSTGVKDAIKQISGEKLYLDNINRQILNLIGKGIKTKNLPNHLNLSISAIDKRKAQIKDILGLIKGNDQDIIVEARRRKLI